MTAGKAPEISSEHSAVQGEALYELLFQNSLDGLMLTAPDGKIFEVNPSACRILGRTREEILLAGREGLVDPEDPRVGVLVEERRRNGRAHGEIRARHGDGTLFPVEISSVVFEDQQGQARTCLIIRDISERKAAEEERERLIHQLRDALAQVNQLRGLLPMCASCRKIRDKQGGWLSLEQYVRQHTEAEFTHGICPECRRQLYPETVK